MYYLETLIDIIFGTDIFVNFLSSFERSDGVSVFNLKKIAFNYVTGFFFIDFVSSFPFGLVMSLAGDSTQKGKNMSKSNSILKLARLQRLYRLLRIIRIIKVLNIDNYNLGNISCFKNLFSRVQKQLLKIIFGSICACHLASCFNFMIAKF